MRSASSPFYFVFRLEIFTLNLEDVITFYSTRISLDTVTI
jgi:hypothetical protein